jgi:hypothetical protein
MSTITVSTQRSRSLYIALWVAQVLAAAFFMAGAMKLITPIEELHKNMPGIGDLPVDWCALLGSANWRQHLDLSFQCYYTSALG